jgi:primosomal protein N' (replication factor Y)
MKPLRLKREIYLQPGEVSDHLPLAKVLVDTQVAHLDQPFDYLVPKKFDRIFFPGSLVEVDFGGKKRLGVILSRSELSEEAKSAKTISKALGDFPVISKEVLDLVIRTAQQFAGDFFSILRAAVPERMASVDQEFAEIMALHGSGQPSGERSNAEKVQGFIPLYLPLSDYSQITFRIEQILSQDSFASQILIIAPDLRVLKNLERALAHLQPLVLSGNLNKSERYRRYLSVLSGSARLVIGSRSAIFLPLIDASFVFILNDQDRSMYDQRNPYWNVREVSLLRQKKHKLHFISSSPSLEVLDLIKKDRCRTIESKSQFRERGLKLFQPKSGESYLSAIKSALHHGHVLVTINDPGYISTFACNKCRNLARCPCGGKLAILDSNSNPTCSLCGTSFPDWRCEFCQSSAPRIVNKGSAKMAEELGRSFPKVRIIISNSSSGVEQLPDMNESTLVISTYGCEPQGEYELYVGLNLEFAFSGTNLRSYEEVRLCVTDNLLRVRHEGSIYLELPSEHPFLQNQLSGNFSNDLKTELESRSAAKLPPIFQIAVLIGEQGELRELQNQLKKVEFIAKSTILRQAEEGKRWELILRSEKEGELSKFLLDLRRYRSLKKLKPFEMRIDPYSI